MQAELLRRKGRGRRWKRVEPTSAVIVLNLKFFESIRGDLAIVIFARADSMLTDWG